MRTDDLYKTLPKVDYYGDKKPSWTGKYVTDIFYFDMNVKDYISATINTYWDGKSFHYINLEDIENYDCAFIWQWAFWAVPETIKTDDGLKKCIEAGITSDMFKPVEKGRYEKCRPITLEQLKKGYRVCEKTVGLI